MGFNYAKEKARLEAKWRTLRPILAAEGTPPEKIDDLYRHDLDELNHHRRFARHTQAVPLYSDGAEDRIALSDKFSGLAASFDETDFMGRYDWLQTIEDEALLMRLKLLSRSQLELLTLIVFDECSQAEAARILHCTQSGISKKLRRIKNILQKLS